MICWMFPGQPLRRDQDFPADNDGQRIIALCRDATGFDLFRTDADYLDFSEHVQLQLYGTAMSLHHAARRTAAGERPDLVIEHSMGIYAALAVCGCISERDALELTAKIGNALARRTFNSIYALGCIVGLSEALTESVAAKHGVYLANYNTSNHFLLAGDRTRIMQAMEECSAAGAFSVSVFDCDAPLHTPLLNEAADELRQIISGYRYREANVPLLEHISQTLLAAPDIPGFLLNELLKPVWWERSYRSARLMGVTRFEEVGSGNALKKFNRWIDTQP